MPPPALFRASGDDWADCQEEPRVVREPPAAVAVLLARCTSQLTVCSDAMHAACSPRCRARPHETHASTPPTTRTDPPRLVLCTWGTHAHFSHGFPRIKWRVLSQLQEQGGAGLLLLICSQSASHMPNVENKKHVSKNLGVGWGAGMASVQCESVVDSPGLSENVSSPLGAGTTLFVIYRVSGAL